MCRDRAPFDCVRNECEHLPVTVLTLSPIGKAAVAVRRTGCWAKVAMRAEGVTPQALGSLRLSMGAKPKTV